MFNQSFASFFTAAVAALLVTAGALTVAAGPAEVAGRVAVQVTASGQASA